MDIFFIVIAFIFGFAVKQIGLPPLVGFLTAGFFLNAMGYESTEVLHELADIGIILLLFSIGLKVQMQKLLKPQVWATASLHMLFTVIILGGLIFGLSLANFSYFSDLSLTTSFLFSFALSFSSTVFAVKVLEERAEMASSYGRIAIGILIMQDLFAVIFITISSGEIPSILALGLFLLFFLRKPIGIIINRSGHGELLVLLACILPIAGANLFEQVGLKPDLGALVLGMLLAGHPKTDELGKAMFGFKDLFLVGFFLTIGMADLPNFEMVKVAGVLLLFIPLKVALFYLLMTKFQLRARTSLFASLNLANYSEFGLIVGAVGVKSGWLASEWLVVIAVAASLSMILASPLGSMSSIFYTKSSAFLKRFETRNRLPEDEIIDIGGATVAILGMGRVGSGAYEQIAGKYKEPLFGMDFDSERIQRHRDQGRNIVQGDATDDDFWQRGISNFQQVKLILLTMSFPANMKAINMIREKNEDVIVAAAVIHDDQIEPLKAKGVNYVFNIYGEAGIGFSDHVCNLTKIEPEESNESKG